MRGSSLRLTSAPMSLDGVRVVMARRIDAPRAPRKAPAAEGAISGRAVDLAAGLLELGCFFAQALGQDDGLGRHALLGGVLADFLRDLHRAELRPAHRAEVGELGAVGRQRLVVELARGLGIEREVELVLPAELEARLAERVVRLARAQMALGQVGG